MTVFVGTHSGFRVFTGAGEGPTELSGRQVCAVALEAGGTWLAVIDRQEIWRRDAAAAWSRVATASIGLQSIVSVDGTILGGGSDEAAVVRIHPGEETERLKGFDNVPGRGGWFAGGPPLGVRSLTATVDGAAILAGVHVGGIPRSTDGGETWAPTIPINFDVHEVRAHSCSANIVAAATAVGLCVSHDGGQNWRVLKEGLELTDSLAVAVLSDEALFSIQDGPSAKRSQVWRWRIGGERLEPVRDGLPEWLEGKVDTAHIAAGGGRAAIVDRGGNLWVSTVASCGWQRLATGLPYVFGVLIL
jgi:hypothetical protein